jgi:hypothetical protein
MDYTCKRFIGGNAHEGSRKKGQEKPPHHAAVPGVVGEWGRVE